jgi:DNA uptake protein ComE-like DNA-binding protein
MLLRCVPIALTALILLCAGCSPRIEDTAEYQAICHGPPLRNAAEHEKAQEDGYDINRRFDCITKDSYAAIQEGKARWETANTPEAKAKRQAELDEQHARYMAEQQHEAAKPESEPPLPKVVLKPVDVNSASEADIAAVISIGPQLAAQIVAERDKHRFSNWSDLVARVVGLGAARPAAFASVCGLTVNGQSLDGAPPNADLAASIQQRYKPYQNQ